jgi:general secretion pathway protein C
MSLSSPFHSVAKSRLPNTVTALIWLISVASVAYWVLQFPQAKSLQSYNIAQNNPSFNPEATADVSAQLLRGFGGMAAGPEVSIVQSSRYQLLGVIASASGQGSALIAVDGQPPKPFKVGQTVQDDWVLSSLTARKASLKSSSKEMLLELPAIDNP